MALTEYLDNFFVWLFFLEPEQQSWSSLDFAPVWYVVFDAEIVRHRHRHLHAHQIVIVNQTKSGAPNRNFERELGKADDIPS